MWDALRQSLGKRPDQRLLMIGTRAPGDPNGWWCNLLEAGSGDGVYVDVIAAPEDLEDDPQPWDSWRVIRKANPLIMANPTLRKTILRERNRARRDPSERASFEAYRLNRNVDVRSEVLISLADWKAVEARPVPDRAGRPILAAGPRLDALLVGGVGALFVRALGVVCDGSGDSDAGRSRKERRSTEKYLSAVTRRGRVDHR